ncbi:MAG: HAMP domain-containing sensor histidine kinase [Proteobacteria bacterium]|nr:HAMP domain-containing sensor histidine kinase [Pseudomonadota bacterium]
MRGAHLLSGVDKRGLGIILAVFFVALCIPAGVLVRQALGQLKSEAFYQQRVRAEELAQQVDARLRGLLEVEEARSLSDYRFFVLQGDPRANFLQRSPLANYPVDAAIPGLLGYFQIDANGAFSTPLLPIGAEPASYGVTDGDAAQRRALEARVRELLIDADAGVTAPARTPANAESAERAAPAAPQQRDEQARVDKKVDADIASVEQARVEKDSAGQAAFDRLADVGTPDAFGEARQHSNSALGRVEDLQLDSSRIAPFVLRRLDLAHFVLFRKVWLDGERLIQGAIIVQDELLEGIVGAPFRETALSRVTDLIVAYRGDVIAAIDTQHPDVYLAAAQPPGELLYRTALSAPLRDFELIFTLTALPAGPGAALIRWTTVLLGGVLCIGLFVVYRFGAAQIDLNRQQQDFVSAVSHELKTPLTSIRMYGEILKAGWASEEKKQTYYDFIFHESERLSRLIANVLQLARLTRNGDRPEMKRARVIELLDLVESKISAQVEQAGFQLLIDRTEIDATVAISVDADNFVQILINLVDNALKFSARAQRKDIEIGCRVVADGVQLRVRDYGPGIPKEHIKRIFKLFYRAENELTRETVGTGIGLALVKQLASAMGGTVDVHNCDPGAEFFVVFPKATRAAA